MTQEEITRKRQQLVHTMFSSTGDDFVRLVLENCRGGGSALGDEQRERLNTREYDWNGFQWFKFSSGSPKGKTKKILYMTWKCRQQIRKTCRSEAAIIKE